MSYGNITEDIYIGQNRFSNPPFATTPIISNKATNIPQQRFNNIPQRDYKNEYQNYVRQEIENRKRESSIRLKNAKVGRFGKIDEKIPEDPYALRDWKQTEDANQYH